MAGRDSESEATRASGRAQPPARERQRLRVDSESPSGTGAPDSVLETDKAPRQSRQVVTESQRPTRIKAPAIPNLISNQTMALKVFFLFSTLVLSVSSFSLHSTSLFQRTSAMKKSINTRSAPAILSLKSEVSRRDLLLALSTALLLPSSAFAVTQ